jgi:hypothetical protein
MCFKLNGQDTLAVRASKKLRNESQMVSQYAPSLLRGDMDKVPLWRGNHVAVTQLLEDYARYPYLQRVRNPEVILAAIRDGLSLMTWATDSFGYADSWDEAKKRYVGLLGGKIISVTADSTGLLVKPDIASRQLDAEKPAAQPSADPGVPAASTTTQTPGATGSTTTPSKTTKTAPKLKRFHGTVHLDSSRIGRDAGRIAEEVVQHLALLPDAKVEVVVDGNPCGNPGRRAR